MRGSPVEANDDVDGVNQVTASDGCSQLEHPESAGVKELLRGERGGHSK